MNKLMARPRPLLELTPWGDDFDSVLRNFWGQERPEAPGLHTPAVDVAEDSVSLQITAELPGIERKDIALEVKDGILTLRAEKRQELEQKDRRAMRLERRYGSYFRALSLPESVDAGRVDASFKNGVLRVVIPKKEETKARTVAIKE
jgi:HSP20 family protein